MIVEQINVQIQELSSLYSNAQQFLTEKIYNKATSECNKASVIFNEIHAYNKATSEENRVKELYNFQVSILDKKIRIQECIAKASQTSSFCDDVMQIINDKSDIERKCKKIIDLIDSTNNAYTFSELDYLLSKDGFDEAKIYRDALKERTKEVISRIREFFDYFNFLEYKNVKPENALLVIDILKKIAEKRIINIAYSRIVQAEKVYDKFLKNKNNSEEDYRSEHEQNLERIERFRKRILNTIKRSDNTKNTIEEPFSFFESSEHLSCFFNCIRHSRFSKHENNNLRYFFENWEHATNISIHYSYNDLNYYAYILENKDLDYKKIFKNQEKVNTYIRRNAG